MELTILIMLVIVLFFIVVGLTFYLLHGFGLYRMAEKRGISRPWLAFIPIAMFYLLGKVAEEVPGMKLKNSLGVLLVSLTSISFVLNILTDLVDTVVIISLLIIVSLVELVFFVYAYHLLFKLTSENYVLILVINIFTVFFFVPVFVFILRNHERKDLVVEGSVDEVRGE